MRRAVLVLGMLALQVARAAGAPASPSCPGPATVDVYVDDWTGASTVRLALDGDLLDPASACVGPGDISYRQPEVDCTRGEAGRLVCPPIPNLRPGTWVHRQVVVGSD